MDKELLKLISLTVCCPYSQDNPPDCQLHELRQRPIKERIDYVRQLSAAEKAHVLETHRCCLECREGAVSCAQGGCRLPASPA